MTTATWFDTLTHALEPEVAALAQQIGDQPEAAWAWVDANVGVELYVGHLRDPRTVLAARRGNALDRAGLVRALLAAAGRSLGLERRDATPEEVANEVERGLTPDDPPPPMDPGLEAPALEALAAGLVDLRAAVLAALAAREDTEALRDRLRALPWPGLPAAEISAWHAAIEAEPLDVLAALRSLCPAGRLSWLLERAGAIRAGRRQVRCDAVLTTLEEALGPLRAAPAFRTDADRRRIAAGRWALAAGGAGPSSDETHRIRLEIHALVALGDAGAIRLETRELLRVERDAPGLDGRTLWLGLGVETGPSAGLAHGLFGAITGMERHVLRARIEIPQTADGQQVEIIHGGALTFLRPTRTDPLGEDAVTSALRGEGLPIAAWADLTLLCPGAPPDTERRTLFERRADPSAPLDLAQLAPSHTADGRPAHVEVHAVLHVQTGPESGLALAAARLDLERRRREILPWSSRINLARALLADGVGGDRDRALLAQLEGARDQQAGLGLKRWYGMRARTTAWQAHERIGVRAAWTRPRVTARWIREGSASYDLIFPATVIDDVDASGIATAPREQLRLGVALGLVEHEAAESDAPFSAFGVCEPLGALDLVRLETGGASGDLPPSLGDPQVAARARAELDAGCVLLVPRRSTQVRGRDRVAWWRLAPGSGVLMPVLDDGTHGTAMEFALGVAGAFPMELFKNGLEELAGFDAMPGHQVFDALVAFSSTLWRFAGEVLGRLTPTGDYRALILSALGATLAEGESGYLAEIGANAVGWWLHGFEGSFDPGLPTQVGVGAATVLVLTSLIP